MKIKAHAKINLTLDIVGRREDGYHLIDSVMQSVSLADTLYIEKAESITVICDDTKLSGESNIAYKAAVKFFEYVGISGGASIRIEKNIPLASGMGGGSADAAAVIKALDRIYETNLNNSKLCEIALMVGADVPFCITGGTARVTGIGEEIEALPMLPNCSLLLIKQGSKLSTADMYKKIDSMPQCKKNTQQAVEGIASGNILNVIPYISNAFAYVSECEKVLADIKKSSMPLAASLSGSGPTVFAVYQDDKDALCAKAQLEKMGYKPILAHPESKTLKFE